MDLKIRIGALLGVLSVVASAQAGTGVAVDIGSTGIGAHVSVPIRSSLNLRFGLNYARYSTTRDTDDANYDLDLRLKTFDALVDYFPGDSAFRISGGAVYNGNQFDTHAKPTSGSVYTLNNNTYPASTAGLIDGTVDFRKVAPYLGIGWGNAAAATGWGFTADLGVLFQGAPNSSLANRGCTAASAICTRLASDLVAENLKLKDEMKDFKFYPVLRVGVSYSF